MNIEQKNHIKRSMLDAVVPATWLLSGIELLRGLQDLPEFLQNIEAHILIPVYIGLMYVGIWPSLMFGIHSIDELFQGLGEPNPDFYGKLMRDERY